MNLIILFANFNVNKEIPDRKWWSTLSFSTDVSTICAKPTEIYILNVMSTKMCLAKPYGLSEMDLNWSTIRQEDERPLYNDPIGKIPLYKAH